MAQYVENVLKSERISGRKSGLERLRMFFGIVPGVQSGEKVDDEKTKTWEDEMKEKLGGCWW